MNILIVGSGGREHALAWKASRSPETTRLYCAPGNPGMALVAECVPIAADDVAGLASFAASSGIDFTIVGPEVPLTLGIVDEFAGRGRAIFGPSREAARLEASKVFSKQFMRRHGIPTAAFEVFEDPSAARAWLEGPRARFPLVVKADGLAAGKGVVVCAGKEQALGAVRDIMEDRIHGPAGDRIVIEECLEGREVSFFAISDGERVLPLATCQDYKRALDGDRGPNTGGMGGYSPSAYVSEELAREILDRFAVPTIAGMASEGAPYRGILYVGLMLTASGPRVLEYNARFGDPETQLLMPRLVSDLIPLLAGAAAGRLDPGAVRWSPQSAATVVVAAEGYPGSPRKGMPVHGIPQAASLEGVQVFQAGTAAGRGAEPVVAGGRVLAVSATAPDLAGAVQRVYEGIGLIRFDGMHYRTDIARDAIGAVGAAY